MQTNGNALIRRILDKARSELLDLSVRNRLLNTPRRRTRTKTLEIVDEMSSEVFRIMVDESKAMTFLSVPTPQDGEGDEDGEDNLFSGLALPEDDEVDERGIAKRHADKRLQTRLTAEKLQKRLLSLYYDARTYKEEQGVNILFLALGFLKWFESESSDRERYAPLILVPANLEREDALDRFKIRYPEDELSTNLSLQARLKTDFGISLPELPDVEDIDPTKYFEEIRKAVSSQQRWEVLDNDIVLCFFSFSKFLMYRDLNPENWPSHKSLETNELLSSLLGDGFAADEPLCGDDESIDEFISPLDMIHVLDADSSQTVAIEEVKRGRNLVLQGPPGTGKSQTIANLIGAAVTEGKKVLFVAEKMAALEVVKRRLENIELGEICLELHSHKANKRHVLEDLSHSLDLSRPVIADVEVHASNLKQKRDHLNDYVGFLHARVEPSGLTPYRIIGELVQLHERNVSPPSFKFQGAEEWTQDGCLERQTLLKEIADRIEETVIPDHNPWRGAAIEAVLPSDRLRLQDQITTALAMLDRIGGLVDTITSRLSIELEVSIEYLEDLARIANHVGKMPNADRQCFANTVWRDSVQTISDLVATGKRVGKIEDALKERVLAAAWGADLSVVRHDLAAHGSSFFRFLDRRYRVARAALRDIMAIKPPKKLQDCLTIVDGLIAGQNARREIEKNDELGRNAFGSLWRGRESDWQQLSKIATWATEGQTLKFTESFLCAVPSIEHLDEIGKAAEQLDTESATFRRALSEIVNELKLDVSVAFDALSTDAIALDNLLDRFKAWLSDMEGLSKWIALRVRLETGDKLGLGPLLNRLRDGGTAPDAAVDQFRYAYTETIMRGIVRQNPDFAAFDGQSHSKTLQSFGRLDRERIELARNQVAVAHFRGIPRGGSGGVGEIGIIRREIAKKRRHMPLRKLMSQAGVAIQAIKPVFMMSPMSIAQFLAPGDLEFDLLLIDEASQVRPVDAIGGIARSRQIVVVGDDKQLPPTRFFARGVGDDADEDDELATGDLESILGLCTAQGMPNRMLRWHYRSHHHSLIAVSNHEFYDDRLYIVPSPYTTQSGLGVTFHHVSDGVFDRGGSATNRREARVIAEAVIEHARTFPHLSLGIGTFSMRQKEAILDELEHLWRTETDVKGFFAEGTHEPFFVKNLETIQGDERDVIFISIGYGPDRNGFFAMTFGPLSMEGGERRLNVLISRARQRCKVFSSVTADDIDLRRASGRGVAALKTFLNYAQTGNLSVSVPTGKEFDSPFEEEVAKEIQRRGYEVEPQVGIAGFFIDIAVIDAEIPGRYLLGVECDGAAYHSARSARDRDRLRQEVLEDHGWIIHRVWSTDWFNRPNEQMRKIIAAIEDAKMRVKMRDSSFEFEQARPSDTFNSFSIERAEPEEAIIDDAKGMASIPSYEEASFDVSYTISYRFARRQEPHEVPVASMATIVAKIVKTEGPIHQEEVARRVSGLWGLGKTGSRIVTATLAGIAHANKAGMLKRNGKFVDVPNRETVPVRDRTNVNSLTLRKPEMLPPSEIRASIMTVVETYVGIAPADLARIRHERF